MEHSMKFRMTRGFVFFLFLISFGTSLSSTATADDPDHNKALSISANDAEIDEPRGWAAYKGNVELKQGELEIKCDLLEIYREGDGISQVIATGKPAYFKQSPAAGEKTEPLDAVADQITYRLSNKSITLEGGAKITQGKTVFEGHTIIYEIENRKIIARSEQNDTAEPTENGRVKIVLPVVDNRKK